MKPAAAGRIEGRPGHDPAGDDDAPLRRLQVIGANHGQRRRRSAGGIGVYTGIDPGIVDRVIGRAITGEGPVKSFGEELLGRLAVR